MYHIFRQTICIQYQKHQRSRLIKNSKQNSKVTNIKLRRECEVITGYSNFQWKHREKFQQTFFISKNSPWNANEEKDAPKCFERVIHSRRLEWGNRLKNTLSPKPWKYGMSTDGERQPAKNRKLEGRNERNKKQKWKKKWLSNANLPWYSTY